MFLFNDKHLFLRYETQEAEKEFRNNPKFKKVYADWVAFRQNQTTWFSLAEDTFSRYNSIRKLK